MRAMKAAALAASVFALVLSACATTTVTGSWKNPEVTPGYRPQKVLVVGLVSAANRHQIEKELAAKLAQRGITAVPSETIFPGADKPSREQVVQAVKENGFDAVLVTAFMGVKQELTYSGYDTYMAGYGFPAYDPIGYGTYRTTEKVMLETNLFDTRGAGEKVWSATTSTWEPGNASAEIPKVVNVIVKRLEKDGLA